MRMDARTLRYAAILILMVSLFPTFAAEPKANYDYYQANRQLIRNGVQAVLTCNGLFTSNRSLQQVFAQELAYLPQAVGTVAGGDYQVDRERHYVSVGGGSNGPEVRAVFRQGIGCVVMAPDQSLEDITSLPEIAQTPPAADPSTIAWPNGDALAGDIDGQDIDLHALQRASDWAFDRDNEEQNTISLIVLHKGNMVLERYAAGFDTTTKTRTWSTAKSIAATLLGILVDREKMSLDGPLSLPWRPEVTGVPQDPRHRITLRHLLNMSSGLYPVDSFGMEYATGSGLAYWAGASSVHGALDRGMIREPGTFFDYENYDTLLAVKAMRDTFGNTEAYHGFPRRALLDKIGMHNTLLSTDRFGDFILSSQVYTNARDLARFGLLYLREGRWNDEQIISKQWIDFVRQPAPASHNRHNDYGGHWWLVPDNRSDVPSDAYATAGNRGQYVVVVPSHDIVIVRRGLDYGRQGFNHWDLTREVLSAFPRH